MRVFPQTMVNITVDSAGKALLDTDDAIQAAIREAAAEPGGRRPNSGAGFGHRTLVRVMVEGPDQPAIEALAQRVAEVIRQRTAC